MRKDANAASRLRRAEVNLGLGPLAVDDRLKLSGEIILRRYWRRDDFRSTSRDKSADIPGYWVNFPVPDFLFAEITANLTQPLILPEPTPRTASWAPWNWVFPWPKTDATLRYSRRDIFDQDAYLFPRLYQSVLNLTQAASHHLSAGGPLVQSPVPARVGLAG